MRPYSLVVFFRDRLTQNESKYVIYSSNDGILFKTNDLTHLKMKMDILDLTVGKRLGERFYIDNFSKTTQYGGYKVIGRAYRLKSKRYNRKRMTSSPIA